MDNSLHPVATSAASSLPWLPRAAALQAGDANRDDSNRCRLLEHPFKRKCSVRDKVQRRYQV